jgi:hypothetical protein
MGSTQSRESNWGAAWKKSSVSFLESREYGHRDPSRWPHGILYPQKLAPTSPTSGCCSVGIVRSLNQATEFSSICIFITLRSMAYMCHALSIKTFFEPRFLLCRNEPRCSVNRFLFRLRFQKERLHVYKYGPSYAWFTVMIHLATVNNASMLLPRYYPCDPLVESLQSQAYAV